MQTYIFSSEVIHFCNSIHAFFQNTSIYDEYIVFTTCMYVPFQNTLIYVEDIVFKTSIYTFSKHFHFRREYGFYDKYNYMYFCKTLQFTTRILVLWQVRTLFQNTSIYKKYVRINYCFESILVCMKPILLNMCLFLYKSPGTHTLIYYKKTQMWLKESRKNHETSAFQCSKSIENVFWTFMYD